MSIYNNDRLDHVKESIESILNQTYTSFDFYISFDGPVISEIDEYVNNIDDTRIKLYSLEENKGLAHALNFLLKIVVSNPQYQLIARMDADDISEPLRFEKQRNFLSENPDISCVGSWYQAIDDTGKHLSYRKLPTDHKKLRKLYSIRTPFAHPSVIYRRSLIEKAGYYPTNTFLMEDNALWGNALKHELKFANIPEYLIQFRISKNFYKRRSGIRYGFNYIKVKFRIGRKLKLPFYSFIYSFSIGVIKMMPPFFIKSIYSIVYKCLHYKLYSEPHNH